MQALRFLPVRSAGPERTAAAGSVGSGFVWGRAEEDLWSYLFCLSEVHELRLPCSEEVLAAAIGYELRDCPSGDQDSSSISSTSSAQTFSRRSAGGDQAIPATTAGAAAGRASESRLLVKTLLRDEGHQ